VDPGPWILGPVTWAGRVESQLDASGDGTWTNPCRFSRTWGGVPRSP